MQATFVLRSSSPTEDILHFLADDLRKHGFLTEEQRISQSNTRGELTTVISIASLALASASLFLNTLKFFLELHPKHSITLKRGDLSFSVSNITRDEFLNTITSIEGSDALVLEVDG